MNKSLKIDEEFQNLLPPLSDKDFCLLEENIILNGCLDSIKVWNGYIIDGHNRYNICVKNDIDFQVMELTFKTKTEVLCWMIDNQIIRRNLNNYELSYFRGKKYEKEKFRHGGNYGNQYTKPIATFIKTSHKLANEFKVSERTIRDDYAFAKAIDIIDSNIGNNIKNKILKKEISISKKEVIKISNLSYEMQLQIINQSNCQKYRNKINNTTIKHLINKSGGFCEICGWGGLGLEGTLVAHHIEKYSYTKNNSMTNIILICRNCHGIIHTLEYCNDIDMKNTIINSMTTHHTDEILKYCSI